MRFVNFIRVAIVLLFGGLMSANAQQWQTAGAWTYKSEGQRFSAIAFGKFIEGTAAPHRKDGDASIFIDLKPCQDGKVCFEFSLNGPALRYDNSGNDRNYFIIQAIADGNKSSLISLKGKNYNEKSWMEIRSSDNNTVELYNMFKSANDVYIRVANSNGTIAVMKFSANGFSKAMEIGHNYIWDLDSNPFSNSNNSSNPFKG